MDSKILEYMIAIADEKSISRAADLFFLTQPVMSRHLQNVEREIGAPLFIRHKREMKLTDAGRIFISRARLILYTEKKMVQDLETLRRNRDRHLRITADDSVYLSFERAFLRKLLQVGSKVDVTVSAGGFGQALTEIRTELTDYAVLRSEPLHDPSLEAECIFCDSMVLCVPREWIGEDMIPDGPLSFPERYIIMEETNAVLRHLQQSVLHDYYYLPRNAFEVAGIPTTVRMVARGEGMAILPASALSVCGERVAAIALKKRYEFNTYLVCDRHREKGKYDAHVKDVIRGLFKEDGMYGCEG